MSTLPKFVLSALHAERKASIATVAAVCVHIFTETKNGRTPTELGAALHDAAPWRSLATWRNYASVAKNLLTHTATAARMESDYTAAKAPADACTPFGRWLAAESDKLGYSVDINDLNNYAKGKPSARAVAAANKKADDDAAAARAAAAVAAAAVGTPPVAVPQPNDGPATAAAAAAGTPDTPVLAPRGVDAPAETAATGYPPAILSDVVSVQRDGAGFSVRIAVELTPDEIRAIAEFLLADADIRTVAATMEPATATA